MKKHIITITICFLSSQLWGQTNMTRLGTEVKKITGEWLNGFKNIKGAIKSDSETEAIYCSRLKVAGSNDSTNLIRYIKGQQVWAYSVDFDKANMNTYALDSIIKDILFSFGKVELTTTNIAWSYAYVPANKKGASEKLRCFYILVVDRQKDPQDNTGGMLTLTISDDNYFRSK